MLLLIVFFVFFTTCFCQKNYWQQQVNVSINVSLNDKDHTIDAFETLEYINNSPDTLHFIWFHLWPNAYKNDKTAFSEQMLKMGFTSFYFSQPEDRGYINRLNFKVDNISAGTEADTNNIDIIKLVLPAPLAPGKNITITTPFHVKLPYNFSRSGHIGNDYQVTQWFPKPAVYDSKGWHPMPYLDQGEFYSEFGDYDVKITLPGKYVVAATGHLQDAATLKEIIEKGKHTDTTAMKTWCYKQDGVHDFAWFASKDFTAMHDTCILPSGKVVDVFSFFTPKEKETWKEAVKYAKDGLTHYSQWIGDYPYDICTVVQGYPDDTKGGMEYPTITLINTVEKGRELDATIVHEAGHNWFYAALANNEREHAWMDEGMNTYYQKRYEALKYGTSSLLQVRGSLKNKIPDDIEEDLLRLVQKRHKDQPIETLSQNFTYLNYGLIVYIKASVWMKQLEKTLGTSLFDSCMRQYYKDWKFKHPYPEDFQQSIESTSRRSLQPLFDQLHTTGQVSTDDTKKSTKISLLFNLKDPQKYNYINVLPAVGYNNYDKVMAGIMAHNYQLLFNRFQYAGGLLYATGTKKINEFARVSYTQYGKRYSIEPSLSFMSFTQNQFKLNENNEVFPAFRKIVPSLKATFVNKNPLNTNHLIAQWKTFFIKSEELDFKTVITPSDTTNVVGTKAQNSVVNRLSLTYLDNRTLYPYSFDITTDQGKGFIRSTFTGKYYFNYKEEKTGMQARLFAGKFFYTGEKTIREQLNKEKYFLSLSGPIGREDYTYSNYFIGRREFDGFMSQQIMERDGFFKVKAEQLSGFGKTDNWLVSLNLVSDVPAAINPLIVLPVKIPLKFFVDIGTYSQANEDNANSGRFLYDAGLQVPLFGSIVNIYVPVLYSKVYRDFFKSTIPKNRFLKTITFSIDVQKLSVNRLFKDFQL